MGNFCFGRVDDPESPRSVQRRSTTTNNSDSGNTRLRNSSVRHRNLFQEYYLHQYYENDPIFHPTPGVSRPMSQLTEEEQIIIATRLGLLNSLAMFIYDESNKEKYIECIICMCDYVEGEECRHLPCLHTFHRKCIDEWLLRSFTCPSCLEQVDIVLLSNQNAKNKISNQETCDNVSKKRKRRSSSSVDSGSQRISRQQSRLSQKSKADSMGIRTSPQRDSGNIGSSTAAVSEDSNSASALLLHETNN